MVLPHREKDRASRDDPKNEESYTGGHEPKSDRPKRETGEPIRAEDRGNDDDSM